MDQVAGFLNCIEEALGLSNESQIASILENLNIGPARGKELQNTKSWSTNCLIRLFHSHASLKASGKKQPEFVAEVQGHEAVQAWLSQECNTGWRIEPSGFITCVDMTPGENNSAK